MIDLPIYTIGFLSSLITELFKFFPFIGKSDLGKSLTALIVIALATFLTVGFTATNFFSVMLYAFLNYKMILQPITKGLSLSTQNEQKFSVGKTIILLGIILVLVLSQPLMVHPSEIPPYLTPRMAITGRNSLIATSSPNTELTLTYRTLISCIAFYESTNNEKAVGDNNSSFGLMQFKKPTWKENCIDDHGFTEEQIWIGNFQKMCADRMLEDNFQNVYLWSVWPKCL